MAPEKKSFVNVDELIPRISLEQLAAYYGVELPELKRIGSETRTRCFLACGRATETGDRVLAIQEGDPAKKWHCHQYGCGKGGNLVSMCDFLKPGTPSGGRPRGVRFKEIAADLKAIVEGKVPEHQAPASAKAPEKPKEDARGNVPLKDSPNERARGLVDLDRKFIVDIAKMTSKASAYFRRRAFLSPDVCRAWRMGFLPRDTGDDKCGGTLRGNVVYPYVSEAGDVLCWFGRNVDFEEQYAEWEAKGKTEREPEKFHFVKGFHRGLELWGQDRLREEALCDRLKPLGLILVEGPNDVIRLTTLGVPSVALCSNTITREQAAKAAAIAREVAGSVVTVFLDCDEEGENGMRQCLGYLAQLTPVRFAWTSKMYGGKFKGRQPETLRADDWAEIRDYLVGGKAGGSSVA